MNHIDLVLGVDQTGAVDRKGHAKPLPACFLERAGGFWQLKRVNNGLRSFDYIGIEEAIGKEIEGLELVVVVDAVIGLPVEFQQKGVSPIDQLCDLIILANQAPGYGFNHGEEFFTGLLESIDNDLQTPPPRRKVEAELGANSVFQLRPFQRNVQTGTFRVWRDLGGCDWLTQFRFWPWQTCPKYAQPLVMEGYPSLAWKILNGTARLGSTEQLQYRLSKNIQGLSILSELSPDELDAAFLALLFLKMNHEEVLKEIPQPNIEGHILGARH